MPERFQRGGEASQCWQRFGVLESLRHERKRSVWGGFVRIPCPSFQDIVNALTGGKERKKFEEKERENERKESEEKP